MEVPELSAFLRQENGSLVYSDGVTVESLFPGKVMVTTSGIKINR